MYNSNSELELLYDDVRAYLDRPEVDIDDIEADDVNASKAVWIDGMLHIQCWCCGRVHVHYVPREPDTTHLWRCPRWVHRHCVGAPIKLVTKEH